MDKFKGRKSSKFKGRNSNKNTSRMVCDNEDNRWNGLWGEISKLFDVSLQCIFPSLDKKCLPRFISPNDEDECGDCKCKSVLGIWPELRNNLELKVKYPDIKVPRDVGKKIKEKLLESDMVTDLSLYEEDKLAPTCDVGFVTFSLSRKWMTKSIHKMLKDGIDTWAPDLDRRVVVLAFPSVEEEIHIDLLRRKSIRDALARMLKYSSAVLEFGESLLPHSYDCRYVRTRDRFPRKNERILDKWFSNEEKEDVVIIRKLSSIPAEADADAYKYFKQPIRLAKTDFDCAYLDLEIMWLEHSERSVDWVVFITPVRQQEYIEMCFLAAKLEKRI